MGTKTLGEVLIEKKRNFHRIIVKTNTSSLSQARMEQLRKKIKDPSYIAFAIEKLAENVAAKKVREKVWLDEMRKRLK
ncbi:MAG: hypothetical protein NC930_06995 [Candidatus Omnitrophica bacterium]|nr:hypothetical protein [Candidatus Omnitrophota bacterium]